MKPFLLAGFRLNIREYLPLSGYDSGVRLTTWRKLLQKFLQKTTGGPSGGRI